MRRDPGGQVSVAGDPPTTRAALDGRPEMKNWRALHTDAHMASVTDAEIATWRDEIARVDRLPAAEQYRVERDRYERLCKFVEEVFPAGHVAYSGVRGLEPVKPRLDAEDFGHFVRRVVDQRQRENAKANAAALHARAIVFLHQRGKVPGVDYDVAKAADLARAIVCEELIAKRVAAEGSFDCHCEVCHTWDGESNRCECGNVRCCWEHGGTFEDPSVYVVGY